MVRVSAITIFHNEERFLAAAIASVRAQSFTDWELILVDDGSTDRSPAIAREAARTDPRIRIVTHPGGENRGMSASRNRGIAAAFGDYIGFLDGDDEWLPEKLAEQVALLDAMPEAEMLYGRTLIWHSWDPAATEADYYVPLGVAPNRLYAPPTLFRLLMRNRAQTPTTNNAIMRRSLFARVGGFEDEFRTLFEDQVFFAKAHLAARCYVSDRVWARYRQHDASCTGQTHILRELASRARFLRWLGRYMTRQHRADWRVWTAWLFAGLDCRTQQARAWGGRMLGRG